MYSSNTIRGCTHRHQTCSMVHNLWQSICINIYSTTREILEGVMGISPSGKGGNTCWIYPPPRMPATRIITLLVENLYKPLFATVIRWGGEIRNIWNNRISGVFWMTKNKQLFAKAKNMIRILGSKSTWTYESTLDQNPSKSKPVKLINYIYQFSNTPHPGNPQNISILISCLHWNPIVCYPPGKPAPNSIYEKKKNNSSSQPRVVRSPDLPPTQSPSIWANWPYIFLNLNFTRTFSEKSPFSTPYQPCMVYLPTFGCF